jgi:hypothetical protein
MFLPEAVQKCWKLFGRRWPGMVFRVQIKPRKAPVVQGRTHGMAQWMTYDSKCSHQYLSVVVCHFLNRMSNGELPAQKGRVQRTSPYVPQWS